jgi:5-methylcytosine-specific restriction endonuclease McrA
MSNANRPRQKSTDWPVSRKRARERDNEKCRNCDQDYDLQVHHILPESKGGSDDLENLEKEALEE